MEDKNIILAAAGTLFTGLVALMKYLLNQKDNRIKELETKNTELTERLISIATKSRGKK